MPTLDFEFEVFCARCGAGLCMNCTEGKTKGRGMPFISVGPCDKCMEDAEEKGDDTGYDRGYNEARKEFEDA